MYATVERTIKKTTKLEKVFPLDKNKESSLRSLFKFRTKPRKISGFVIHPAGFLIASLDDLSHWKDFNIHRTFLGVRGKTLFLACVTDPCL